MTTAPSVTAWLVDIIRLEECDSEPPREHTRIYKHAAAKQRAQVLTPQIPGSVQVAALASQHASERAGHTTPPSPLPIHSPFRINFASKNWRKKKCFAYNTNEEQKRVVKIRLNFVLDKTQKKILRLLLTKNKHKSFSNSTEFSCLKKQKEKATLLTKNKRAIQIRWETSTMQSWKGLRLKQMKLQSQVLQYKRYVPWRFCRRRNGSRRILSCPLPKIAGRKSCPTPKNKRSHQQQ